MHATKLRVLALTTVVGLALVLIGCSTTPSQTTPSRIDLQGLWAVTPGPGTSYGAGGTTTLEFGTAASGSADFLSQSSANDITTCERHVYAALTENVVLLDGTFYQASKANPDRIVLENGTDTLTLDRIAGTPPVAPCAEATATELGTFADSPGSFTGLNAVGPRLYFNIDDSSDSIVAYDTLSNTLGTPRSYSQSVMGGTHRWVIGARTDDLFYGHCGCGGSTSVNYFNLGTNTSLTAVDTGTDLGVEISVRYGYFAGSTIVVGGNDYNDYRINRLLTLNQDTLALVSQRQILREAYISDLTLRGADLLALVRDSIVVIGPTGRATQTIKLTGTAGSSPRGIAAIGSAVYVLDENAVGEAVLYRVAMP